MKHTTVLVILDGWGIGKPDESNPIHIANPKTVHFIESHFPAGALQASGISAGLPWDAVGNSEVGHLTIGAGRILYQHFPKISMAIDDGSFFENRALKDAFAHAREHNSAVHIAGLLTSGSVHASLTHLAALVKMAKQEKCSRLFFHLFGDGVDSAPRSAEELLKKLNEKLAEEGFSENAIASIMGRYYAMERDEHWERTEKAYDLLVGKTEKIKSLKETIQETYEKGFDDKLIEPTKTLSFHPVQSNDALIFFNFREDSMQQIVEPFVNPDFARFPIEQFKNLFVATLTSYTEKFPVAVAFPNEEIRNPLGKVLAEKNLVQLRIAETEKYAHVTYFFNALQKEPFRNEYRVMIPSQKIGSYDEHPEMMANAITDRILMALNEGGFDFILANYANGDLIAHTGNFEATVKAVATVDGELRRLVEHVLSQNHTLVITADHGNAEALIETSSGMPETKHNASPVPFYLVRNDLKRDRQNQLKKLGTIGLLSDVAPTILELMGIQKPDEMTGQSLLSQLY